MATNSIVTTDTISERDLTDYESEDDSVPSPPPPPTDIGMAENDETFDDRLKRYAIEAEESARVKKAMRRQVAASAHHLLTVWLRDQLRVTWPLSVRYCKHHRA